MFVLLTYISTLFLLAEGSNAGPYENITKPVTDFLILNVTWQSITIKFFLHPELKSNYVTYVITVRNSSSFYYQHNITLINYSWLSYQAIKLTENALFYINIQIKDGPSLDKEIECRTKAKYPPPTSLSVQNVSSESAIIEVVLSKRDLDFTLATVFRVKCIIFTSFVLFENSYKIMDYLKGNRTIILTNLNEFTNYTVLVATGDGKVFGLHKSISFQTKVKYPAPIYLSAMEISDAVIIAVGLPYDIDLTVATQLRLTFVSLFKSFENVYKIEGYGLINITVKHLFELTDYNVLVATGNGTMFGSYKNISFRTRVKYPPPTCISVIKVLSESAVIKVDLPKDLDPTLVTELRVKCINFTSFALFENSYKIMDYLKGDRTIIVTNLNEFTNYTVLVATGDGKAYGMHKSILFQTKVKYPPPTSLSVYEISTDTVIFGVVLPNDIDLTVASKLKVKIVSVVVSFENLYDIKDYKFKNITIRNLVEFTDYDVLVATGNGTVFGVYNNASFQTKAQSLVPYCKNEKYRGVTWPTTPSGSTLFLSCPKNSTGNVSRKCIGVSWQPADMKSCISDQPFLITEPKSVMDVSKESMRLSSYVMSKDSIQFGSDLASVIGAVESLVKSSQRLSEQLTNFSETMFSITNHLLDRSSTIFWNDLPQEKRSKDAIKLLKATDDVIETFQSNNLTSKVVESENMVVSVKKLLPGENVVTSKGSTVEIPEDMLNNEGKSTLVVTTYNGLDRLIGIPEGSKLRTTSSNLTLNSKVITVSVFPPRPPPFKSPVVIVQKFEKFLNGTTPNCVYLDDFNGSSFWSDNGCEMTEFNESHVTCRCSHLTNFAVLMSVTDTIENLSDIHVMAMDMITAFGLSVSLITLLASFLSFVFIKTIHSLRNTIHKNVVFALFVAELIFLLGIDKTESRIGCQVVAVLLHYFFLASFFLMALEGVVLYIMLVHVFKLLGKPSIQVIKYIVACWVFPGLVVIVNLLIDYNAYGSHRNHCWLSVKSGFVWSFVGPVLVIISINIIIFIKSLHVVSVKVKKRSSNVAELWFWIKSTFLLICLLGITWLVGIFYIDSRSLFFGYVFTIVNSLQGFLIFLFHCVLDARVRKAWYEFLCCQFSENKDTTLQDSRKNSITLSSRFSFSKKSRQSFGKKTKKGDTPENSLALLTANSK